MPYADDDGVFMQGNLAALLTRSTRLASRWPRHTLVAIAGRDVVGRALGMPCDSVCALKIAIHP